MQQYNKVQYNDAQYNDADSTLTNVNFHQYNRLTYNTQQYNARADFFVSSLADAITPSDVLTFLTGKALSDSVTAADVLAKLASVQRIDNIFISENFQKGITNKALNETVRLAAWLIENRYPGENGWGDQ
jgi:hypothetical protein